LVYGIVLAYSFLNQFYVPAESATLPSVLSKESLPTATDYFFLPQQAVVNFGFWGQLEFKQLAWV